MNPGECKMWNKKIVCKKCDAVITKYDKRNKHHKHKQNMQYCPYCGNKVTHKDWSPNL
jgi:RNA polymerase subunit RPABC4/transcription elongation factor Spt4